MSRPNRKTVYTAVVIVLLLSLSAFLHVKGHLCPPEYDLAWGLPRSFILMGLFVWWGISIRRRIIQTQVRRYLTGIAVLMFLWMTMRTIKYFFVTDPAVARQLWYFYYFPMLFIPLLALFVALSLGKPENYRLPRWTAVFYLAAGLLVLLVLTNDFHRLVFTFSSEPWSDHDNEYAFGYWLAIGWDYACTAAAIITMMIKCRMPQSRRRVWMPLVPVAGAVIYGLLYLSRAAWLRLAIGDVCTCFGLFTIMTLEGCIRCGLIRSNSHYAELFHLSTVKMQITDSHYHVRLSSKSAETFAAEIMRKTETAPVLLENGVRLSGASVRDGHVLWEEDVSELIRVTRELEDIREHLQGHNTALAEKLKTKRRRRQLAEQNRLYNKMQTQTAAQVDRLSALADGFEKTQDPAEEKALLCEILLLGIYLKRRNNLIFLAEDQGNLSAAELFYCIRESLQSLTLFPVAADQLFELDGEMPFFRIMWFYDVFEQVLESSFHTLTALFVRISHVNECPVMSLRLCCGADLSQMDIPGMQIVREEPDEWLLTCRYPEGGAVQ